MKVNARYSSSWSNIYAGVGAGWWGSKKSQNFYGNVEPGDQFIVLCNGEKGNAGSANQYLVAIGTVIDYPDPNKVDNCKIWLDGPHYGLFPVKFFKIGVIDKTVLDSIFSTEDQSWDKALNINTNSSANITPDQFANLIRNLQSI